MSATKIQHGYLAREGGGAHRATLLLIGDPQEALGPGVQDFQKLLQRQHDLQQPHPTAQQAAQCIVACVSQLEPEDRLAGQRTFSLMDQHVK